MRPPPALIAAPLLRLFCDCHPRSPPGKNGASHQIWANCQNEIDAIRRRGGCVVWVYSPNVAKADGPFKPHRSDRMIGQLDCDVVLVNDGLVEMLTARVELAVELGARAFESGKGLGHEWTTPKPNGRQPIRRRTRGRPWRRWSFSTP